MPSDRARLATETTERAPTSLNFRTSRPATGVSRALWARSVPGSVTESVPENGGVRVSVAQGVSHCLRGLRALSLSKKFQKVSRECPGHFFDTPETGALPGTLRAPVAGRGVRNSKKEHAHMQAHIYTHAQTPDTHAQTPQPPPKSLHK